MNSGVDFETNIELKEKRIKSLHAKNKNKTREKDNELEYNLEKLLREKKKTTFKEKPLKEFRNNHKKFQYDYEEDPYEPIYEEDTNNY